VSFRGDLGGGSNWSRDERSAPSPFPKTTVRPTDSVWAFLLATACALVALGGFSGAIYFTVEEHLPRIVGIAAGFAVCVVALLLYRGLAPVARALHQATARGPRGGTRSAIAAVTTLALVIGAIAAMLAWRGREARFEALRSDWDAARSALSAGQIVRFDRRWDTFHDAVRAAARDGHEEEQRAAAFEDQCAREAAATLVREWPKIERRIGTPEEWATLKGCAPLKGTTALDDCVRAYADDLRARGVRTGVVVPDEPGAEGWRDDVLDALREEMSGSILYTKWPLKDAPEPSSPAILGAVCTLTVAELNPDHGRAPSIFVPTSLGVVFATQSGASSNLADRSPIVLGPIDTEDPRVAAFERQMNVPNLPRVYSQAEALALRTSCRERLLELLSAALAGREPPPDRRWKR
jgi:hypothetical protein